MPLHSNVLKKVIEGINALYCAQIEESQVQIQKTNKEFSGDITVVVFPLVRISKKSPEQTASDLGTYLIENTKWLDNFDVKKGFLNLTVSAAYYLNFLQEEAVKESFGQQGANKESELVMVEYSSPNTNKPLHLGHIRNNLLGWSICKILEANGKRVKKTNLVNDRGIHICKSMLAYDKWGNNETPESSGKKGDHLVGDYYVRFDQEYKNQLKGNIERFSKGVQRKGNLKYKKIIKQIGFIIFERIDEYFQNPYKVYDFVQSYIANHEQFLPFLIEIKDRFRKQKKSLLTSHAQDMLRRWEMDDPEIRKLWEMMNGWVKKGFQETYDRLGVSFNKIYYESDTYLVGRDSVLKGLDQDIFYKHNDGSVWVDLTAEGLDEKVLLRSDGTSVYITQDIGTAQLRQQDYDFDKMIYVVGNEQNYHFKVLSVVLDKLGFAWAKNLYHLSYGMVELPEGRMKSREGTVVDADDLMDEMISTARKMADELGKLEGLTEEEKEDIYRIIGLGALKYFILKVDPAKNMTFNPEESIDFNGHTGPFIQYTHARIRSVLRKAKEMKLDASQSFTLQLSIDDKEKSILKLLHEYPNMVAEAATNYNPALIANHIYDLVKEYNQFYHDHPILIEKDHSIRIFRLKLTEVCGNVIKKGMSLLGIEVPERM